jgi:hypothetical protein
MKKFSEFRASSLLDDTVICTVVRETMGML